MKTFLVNTGFTLGSTAPILVFIDPHRLLVGASAILRGTASDASGVKRVQVYEGPVLIGSNDLSEYSSNGVAEITLIDSDWAMQWTAPTERTYTIKAIEIDNAGNQSEHTRSVTASRPIDVNFYNNSGLYLAEPVRVGAILRLTGYDEVINHDDFAIKSSKDGEELVLIAHGNADEAASKGVPQVIFEVVHHMWEDEIIFSESIWSVLWRPGAPGIYSALASDGAAYHDAIVAITVQ